MHVRRYGGTYECMCICIYIDVCKELIVDNWIQGPTCRQTPVLGFQSFCLQSSLCEVCCLPRLMHVQYLQTRRACRD